jgi:hypothetical protein
MGAICDCQTFFPGLEMLLPDEKSDYLSAALRKNHNFDNIDFFSFGLVKARTASSKPTRRPGLECTKVY